MPVEPPPTGWRFPDLAGLPVDGHADDLVGAGADLEPGTLLAAYRHGLFPMPDGPSRRRRRPAPMLWWSPVERGVLPLDALVVSRSLRRALRRSEVRVNTAFAEVLAACADPSRRGSWIDADIQVAYTRLHELGWAHSVECYDEDALVGGLYGVRIGGFFAGESMFHSATDASKVALVRLVEWLRETGGQLLDVQWPTPHLATLGAVAIPRDRYLELLADAVRTGSSPAPGSTLSR
jgi:leucyl/phenylalanyl-tRNA---protein transferase